MTDEERTYTPERLRRLAADLRETAQTGHGLASWRRMALTDAAHVLDLAADNRLEVER